MALSSLVLPSFSPKTLIFSKIRDKSLPFISPTLSLIPSHKIHNKPLSVSSSFPSLRRNDGLSFRFFRKFAVSSRFGLDDEVSSEGGESSFSPDLKLFVGNLPFNVDSAELAGLFEQAGNVEMVEVIYDKQTGRSRGFGFVTMSTVKEVKAAAQQLNGYELEGRPLRVNYGPPPCKEDSPSQGVRTGASVNGRNQVYVSNLSWGVDDSDLETLFSEQGRVLEAKVIFDRESGRSRGFGFVTYSSAQEVNNAVSSLDGLDFNGREIRVTMVEERPRRQF